MVYKCIVCNNKSKTTENPQSRISFHSFPTNPDLREQWIKISGVEGILIKPSFKVCSVHFSEDSYLPMFPKSKGLKRTAVPSLSINNSVLSTTMPNNAAIFNSPEFPNNIPTKMSHNISPMNNLSTSSSNTIFQPTIGSETLRRLKLSHTRCFLPAFFLNKNEHDLEGTEILDTKKVGGWQGVVNAFSTDEDGNPSPDVRAILSTICYSSLMGGVYGSLSYSKRAYEDFFQKNQATLFQNQFEAKAKLQSQVTLAMARGVFKWGTRVALFCGSFTTIVTAVNAYTQNVTLISYATAGFVVGGIARISFGMKGFIVGSTLGGILGVIAGGCTLLILKYSSFTMDEVKEWQSQSQIERDLYFVKEQKTSQIFKYDKPPELEEHEKRLQQLEQFQNKE